MTYRVYPDEALKSYVTGAGEDRLDESVKTRNYLAYNIYATYNDTFADAHNVTITAGYNNESWKSKDINVAAGNLSSSALDDLKLATGFASDNNYGGGQNQYVLSGIFGRVNYDYKGRYLFEASGRYDGSSRFGRGSRWGFFPSASLGWRISEESFFAGARDIVDNLKSDYPTVASATRMYPLTIHSYASYRSKTSTVSHLATAQSENTQASAHRLPTTSHGRKPTSITLVSTTQCSTADSIFTADAYIRDTRTCLPKV